MHKYHLEFIINSYNTPIEIIKNSLMEFGDNVEITPLLGDNKDKGENLKINIHTEDPAIIFDTCAQFGRLKSVKIHEG